MLTAPVHPLAGRQQVTMSELGEQNVIAHNEASPAREKVLRLFEQRHEKLNITMALPSLDGIKRAVEMNLGVALLPRRCARDRARPRHAGRDDGAAAPAAAAPSADLPPGRRAVACGPAVPRRRQEARAGGDAGRRGTRRSPDRRLRAAEGACPRQWNRRPREGRRRGAKHCVL